MSYRDRFLLWKDNEFFDKNTREELKVLDLEKDKKEIEDRFYKELEFGTGGLRGVMGAGTNRINKYTVGKATYGLGKYLLDKYGTELCQKQGVVIGYDTRNNSSYLAEKTADVFSAMGIRVQLEKAARPTPQLSFAVKYLNAIAGVVITASHNPKEYNGYKVYDRYGCQLVPKQAKEVIAYVNDIREYTQIPFERNEEWVELIDTTEEFVKKVSQNNYLASNVNKEDLNIVYTPLHGTGRVPVNKILKDNGFSKVYLVEEQSNEDGNFSTVKSPNPEEKNALQLGIQMAERMDADIVLGTDPDSDRVGVAVKTSEGYRLLTGNQIGALLVDFVTSSIENISEGKLAIVKTVVTSELGAEIARRRGIKVFSTLTGFKFIGEKITQFEEAKKKNDEIHDFDFVMGYEESYGYLIGTHARDKDAVVSSLIICEMAAKWKQVGMTLFDRLQELYKEHGYYKDDLESYTLKGLDGLQKIQKLMHRFKTDEIFGEELKEVIDYNNPTIEDEIFGYLPTSNVIKFLLKDNSWVAVRPSGTEPKIKIYYSITGNMMTECEEKYKQIKEKIGKIILGSNNF